jgi:hypothetical protein
VGVLRATWRFRAFVESSEGLLEWEVYLINIIKKPFESLIAEVKSTIHQQEAML